jgi:spore maturation protein CgeB
MKIVIFGLTVSSSWGNGHATLWRGLIDSLAAMGHRVVFFERDVAYYADTRDLFELPGGTLCLYGEWADVRSRAARELADADAAIVTSFCPDGIDATKLVLDAPRALAVFYDLDTPVTLSLLATGQEVVAIGPSGLRDFDLVLSYTGGEALDALKNSLGACRVAPLYGHVDPGIYKPSRPVPRFACDLSYIGTYSADRQLGVEAFFVEPARRSPQGRFVLAGAQYPPDFPWTENIHFVRHLPQAEHPAFYASSRLTLNVTRHAMAAMGWCPSGRLFEATACGAAVLSDWWEGLDAFFEPGREILVAGDTQDVLDAIARSPDDLGRIGLAARDRTLAEHTSARRARQLIGLLESTAATKGAVATLELEA